MEIAWLQADKEGDPAAYCRLERRRSYHSFSAFLSIANSLVTKRHGWWLGKSAHFLSCVLACNLQMFRVTVQHTP